jgi:hypothetical protein
MFRAGTIVLEALGNAKQPSGQTADAYVWQVD